MIDPDSIDCPTCAGQGHALVDGVYRPCSGCGGSGIDKERLASIEHDGPTIRLAL